VDGITVHNRQAILISRKSELTFHTSPCLDTQCFSNINGRCRIHGNDQETFESGGWTSVRNRFGNQCLRNGRDEHFHRKTMLEGSEAKNASGDWSKEKRTNGRDPSIHGNLPETCRMNCMICKNRIGCSKVQRIFPKEANLNNRKF